MMTDSSALDTVLRGLAHHPWAKVNFLRAVTDMNDKAFRRALAQARMHGFIEQASLPNSRHAIHHLALTPSGMRRLGLAYSLADYGAMLCQTFRLELARVQLQTWLRRAKLMWAYSPYSVSARAFSSAFHSPRAQTTRWKSGPVRSLQLDGLVCLQLETQSLVVVALVVDVDGFKLEGLRQQFRSLAAWRRAWALTERRAETLVTTVLTTLHRWPQVLLAWRESGAQHESHRSLRLLTSDFGSEGLARNERAEVVPLWAGVSVANRPMNLPPPLQPKTAQPKLRHSTRLPRSVLTWAKRSTSESARQVRQHQSLSIWARQVLERVGQYPLLFGRDLAVVLGCTPQHISRAATVLQRQGLVEKPAPKQGFVLTTAGLAFLAAQAGYAPAYYARLRGWPTTDQMNRLQYSAHPWLQSLTHTRHILQFLVGLRRYGPSAHMHLRHWEHIHTHQVFSATPTAQVLPDAIGRVEMPEHEVTFWLEVDRGTVRGRALSHKLARYCEAIAWGRRVRLLIVVETEARLQAVRRRLRQLTPSSTSPLDVRLTRVDLLREPSGHLNPCKTVWRTATHPHFVSALGVDQ